MKFKDYNLHRRERMIKVDIRDSDKEDKIVPEKKNRTKRWNVIKTVKMWRSETYLDKFH